MSLTFNLKDCFRFLPRTLMPAVIQSEYEMRHFEVSPFCNEINTSFQHQHSAVRLLGIDRNIQQEIIRGCPYIT